MAEDRAGLGNDYFPALLDCGDGLVAHAKVKMADDRLLRFVIVFV